MSNPNKLNLSALLAGVEVPESRVAPKGVTLGAGSYYFPMPSEIAAESVMTAYVTWAAAVTGTITVEVTNLEDATDGSLVANEWTPINPSTAYVPVTGASNSATAATVTAGGAALGSAMFDLGQICPGARRIRLKFVTSVGGLVRVAANSKLLKK